VHPAECPEFVFRLQDFEDRKSGSEEERIRKNASFHSDLPLFIAS
jgi:hypothetical protein